MREIKTLSLGDDDTATRMQSPDAVNEIASFGRWVRQGGIIPPQLRISRQAAAPSPMTFRLERKTLTAIPGKHNLWRCPASCHEAHEDDQVWPR